MKADKHTQKDLEQKEQESRYLTRFKELYAAFPPGEIKPSERPDFLVCNPDRVIGIEVTEVFQPAPKGTSLPLQQQDAFGIEIVKQAEDLYLQRQKSPLCVQISFKPNIHASRRDQPIIAQNIVNLINKTDIIPGESITLKRTRETNAIFPKQIAMIHIYQCPGGKQSAWRSSSSGWIAEQPPEYIQQRIDEKEKKRQQYAPCDAMWLLMVAHDSRHPSCVELSQEALTHHYSTNFDRVFLLWYATNYLFEFSVSRINT